MRKFLIPLLMASALMPAAAYAAPGDREDRSGRAHNERPESNDNSSNDRPQRAQRVERSNGDAQPVQRAERSNGDAQRVRIERAERPARAERNVDVQANRPARVRRFEQQQQAVQPVQQDVAPVQQVRRTDRRRSDGFVGAIQQLGRDEALRERSGVVVRRDRDGDRRWDGERDRDRRWSRDWRRDSRYNWYNYRHRYGSLFRLGRYYDPYGWNYRRFSIGFNLWPSYYGSNYWLNDPWQYRLPPAYGPYRWVRYFDDALLVNIYTGQVVDVIHNVFW